jgi:hypothetical protein
MGMNMNRYPALARLGFSAGLVGSVMLGGAGCSPDKAPRPVVSHSAAPLPNCSPYSRNRALYHAIFQMYEDGPKAGSPVHDADLADATTGAAQAIIDAGHADDEVTAEVLPGHTRDIVAIEAIISTQRALGAVLEHEHGQNALVGSRGRVTTALVSGDTPPDAHHFTVAVNVFQGCPSAPSTQGV